MPEINPNFPVNYNPSVHKRQIAAKTLNPLIKQYIDPLNTVSYGDISSELGSLIQALTINPDEGLQDAIFSMLFVGLYTGLLAKDLTKDFYGLPKTDFKQKYNNVNAQISFFFIEPDKLQRQRNAKNPKRMQFSVSLRKDASNITRGELDDLVSKIKQQFPNPTSINSLHYCGNQRFSYYDPLNGIQLKGIQAMNSELAKGFIQKICNVFSVQFNLSKMNQVTKLQPYNPEETVSILGKDVKTNKGMVQGYVTLHSVDFIGGNTSFDERLFTRGVIDLKEF